MTLCACTYTHTYTPSSNSLTLPSLDAGNFHKLFQSSSFMIQSYTRPIHTLISFYHNSCTSSVPVTCSNSDIITLAPSHMTHEYEPLVSVQQVVLQHVPWCISNQLTANINYLQLEDEEKGTDMLQFHVFLVSNVRPLMRGQLRNNVDDPGNLQAQLSNLLTKWVLHCKSWSKKFRYIYSENTYFHISTHFEISSTFPEIFPFISDLASDTCTAARKAICRLTNKGRMVFQQKCLMHLQ